MVAVEICKAGLMGDFMTGWAGSKKQREKKAAKKKKAVLVDAISRSRQQAAGSCAQGITVFLANQQHQRQTQANSNRVHRSGNPTTCSC
jgi:hypothetical protein